ncbi:MAG: hypothetical protein AAF725_01095 [Acidobacteriota bacterium]
MPTNPTPHNSHTVTAPLSLLRLIAEDADFRKKVESNPVAAFAEHGVHLSSTPEDISLPDLDIFSDSDKDRGNGGHSNPFGWRGLL